MSKTVPQVPGIIQTRFGYRGLTGGHAIGVYPVTPGQPSEGGGQEFFRGQPDRHGTTPGTAH